MTKRFQKLLIAGLCAVSFNALADSSIPGWYFGLQAGKAYSHYLSTDLFPSSVDASSSGSNGYAGRIFIGYQFYQTNFALESGYTYFQPVKASGGTSTITPSGTLIEQAIDFVGKETLPLGDNFSVYGKLGGAFLFANSKLHLECANPATCIAIRTGTSNNMYVDGTQQRLFPTASIGVSYDVTPRFPVDLAWTRIQKVGGSNLKSTDMISLGAAYILGE